MYYAEGGMARQADNLASRGRGGDTMLVHMNPKEVGGLAALAQYGGDPMTINPDTGLPEAKSSFLKAILPTIVGFALGPAGLGLSAVQAGLIGGGLRIATGGNLQEGIMAGLGAFGGAGLGGALSSMGGGAVAPGTAGANTVTAVAPGTAADVAYKGMQFPMVNNAGTVGNIASQQATRALANNAVSTGLNTSTGLGSGYVGNVGNLGNATEIAKTAADTGGAFSSAMQGAKNVFQPGGFEKLGTEFVNQTGGKFGATLAGAGTLGNFSDAYEPDPIEVKKEEYDYAGPYSPPPRQYTQQSTEDILSGGGREFAYFDPSNPMPGYVPYTAAKGGLLALNKMSNGGLLKGPGDGVSDSIPAVIEGTNQPVRLSDGEYIMPAEVVSAVGDGSSEAGGRLFTNFVNTVMANTRKHEKGKPNGAKEMLKGLTATA
jgi:hypothetical protein